jgi:hypothetical protein
MKIKKKPLRGDAMYFRPRVDQRKSIENVVLREHREKLTDAISALLDEALAARREKKLPA